jgi:hypothetical protein
MHGLQDVAQAEARRLLCILQLWHGEMPADSGTAKLLCKLIGNTNSCTGAVSRPKKLGNDRQMAIYAKLCSAN